MKKTFFISFALTVLIGLAILIPSETKETPAEVQKVTSGPTLEQKVTEYLKSKGSPLAEHSELILKQEHWKLLIAISRIESEWCIHQLGFNCWGIGGDSAYRHYKNHEEAIVDANDLIERWQQKGRWLTIEDMNCSYVVPCSPNWVKTTNAEMANIENLIK